MDKEKFTNPELVVLSCRTFLNKSSIISSNVSMVGITLQHVDLQFDLLLFLLSITDTTEVRQVQYIWTMKSFISYWLMDI